MAYFDRRRGIEVTVYYYDKSLKRAVAIPRADTSHLDHLSDAEVLQWVADWEVASGIGRQRSRRRTVLDVDDLSTLIDTHLMDHKMKSDPPQRNGTLADYRRQFDRFILPYFVLIHSCKDIRKWHLLTDQFPNHLILHHKMPVKSARKVCQTLLRFGRFLVRRHLLIQPWLIELPRNRNRRKAPLARKMDPDEVMQVARRLIKEQNPQWALCLLLGYFGSLRPEELFALEAEDFLFSTAARTRAKAWAGFQRKSLGSGLSIIIDRTLIKKEPEYLTKTHFSRGVVNIFSGEAAKLIVSLLKRPLIGRLFPGARWQLDRQYRENLKPIIGLNAQDLRRASSNYLGKRVGIDPYTIQAHLRHAEMSTTLLYCRDPDERDVEERSEPDYDDVS